MKNIAIVFGKEESLSFDRYAFPILGRPAAKYPLLAALNSKRLDAVFLSSDSPGLLNIGKSLKEIRLLERKASQATLTQEVRIAVKLAIDDIGSTPETVTLLLANSPCVDTTNIDEAITFLENNKSYDSVATAMNRSEFNPMRIFSINEQNQFIRNISHDSYTEEVYFLDRRVMVVRTTILLESMGHDDNFEGILGKNIHPIIQQEGIWDIDYIWQVPIVERWLRQNGFSENGTPYDAEKREFKGRVVRDSQGSAKKTEGKIFNVLITTVPFGEIDPRSIKLLEEVSNIRYTINPIGRKLKERELADIIGEYDVVIAGTEPITKNVLKNAGKLKLISRVGIGLDNVDLHAAKEMGIKVSYSPDAPSPAVAELTIAQMLNMLRRVPFVDRKLRAGIWQRIQGERLSNMIVGIIGTGRIGSRVLKHLQGFNPKNILVNDLKPNNNLYEMYHATFAEKETLYREADIITLHIPLTPATRNLISWKQIEMMKNSVCLINTSRGGIINEFDLYKALSVKRIAAAAIDVFESEPYSGNLIEMDNCLLSCHMGSMTNDCRAAMEIQATEEVIRFINGEDLLNLVPKEEYLNQL
jgi:D-3-phosphoglycerate dehydrogenase / 2-oxoglutarate reductase